MYIQFYGRQICIQRCYFVSYRSTVRRTQCQSSRDDQRLLGSISLIANYRNNISNSSSSIHLTTRSFPKFYDGSKKGARRLFHAYMWLMQHWNIGELSTVHTSTAGQQVGSLYKCVDGFHPNSPCLASVTHPFEARHCQLISARL